MGISENTSSISTLVIEKKLDGDLVAQANWVKYSDSLVADRKA